MKRIFLVLFFTLAFAAMANAQRYGNTTCGLIPGPCAERWARQAYAPVDYYLNNWDGGYGYYPYGDGFYGTGRSAIVGGIAGAATGALTGYLTARAASRRDDRVVYVTPTDRGQTYASAPSGREVRFASKPQKPLDCRKPRGKRGKNEAACTAAEQEAKARQASAERQTCLDRLADSTWRLRNGSDRFPFHPTVDDQPMTICGELVVLRPLQTIRIFPPAGKIGGSSSGANASGEQVEFTAKVRPVNQPGFIGFVLTAPGAPEGGN